MIKFRNRLFTLFVAPIAVAFVNTDALAQDQQITVEATVATFDGQPLEGVALSLYTSVLSQHAMLTDQNGVATWTMDVSADTERVVIQTTGGGHDEFPSQEQLQISLHMKDLSEQYHFPLRTIVDLDPGVDDYTVQITAEEAVQASGTLVDATGAPVEGLIFSLPGDIWPVSSAADGSFVVKGLKRQGIARLFFLNAGAGQVFTVRLTAQQTAANVDVGQVVLDPTPANPFVTDPNAAQLSVEMTNSQAVNEVSIEMIMSGVTLVSTDGSTLYTFMGIRGQTENISVLRSGVVSVAPGDYHVVPGYLPNTLSNALLDAIEADVDLSDSGIPTVTLTADQQTDLQFDMLAAYQALSDALDPFGE